MIDSETIRQGVFRFICRHVQGQTHYGIIRGIGFKVFGISQGFLFSSLFSCYEDEAHKGCSHMLVCSVHGAFVSGAAGRGRPQACTASIASKVGFAETGSHLGWVPGGRGSRADFVSFVATLVCERIFPISAIVFPYRHVDVMTIPYKVPLAHALAVDPWSNRTMHITTYGPTETLSQLYRDL